ncbi:MAG TPA: hypothetical protein VFB79_07820, partial [Candidatus Angelobacter sp.]|nr:hypothetical protein [Candidatus Angelobacter sp.]
MKTRILVTLRICELLMLGALCQTILPSRVLAQSNTPRQTAATEDSVTAGTNAGGASTNSSATNAEIIAELARMRARIAELETQLKAQQNSTKTFVSVAMPKAERKAADTDMVSANSVSIARGGKSDEKKPAEPFAYADWTWLNGNPRTKDAVWDSKFFTPEIR